MIAMRRTAFVVAVGILAAMLVFAGCAGKKKRMEIKPQAVATVTQKVPEGALPEIPAEKGGAGFEKTAAANGWLTLDKYPQVVDSNARKGGMFKLPMSEFPTNLRTDGKEANTTLNRYLEGLCYETLLSTSMTQEFIPGLATHWKISDDKKTFYYRIDPRARWSDGSRVSAEDVVASWKLRIDPTILEPYSNSLYAKFEEPVAESPYIVKVVAKELNWRFFLYFSGMTILPASELKGLTGTEYLSKYQHKMMMGSGLYVIQQQDIVKDQSITLTRRSDYWDKDNPNGKFAGNFDKIKFIVIKDERLMLEKFKKGEFDIYPIGRAQWWMEEFDTTKLEILKRGLIQKVKVFNYEPRGVSGFAMNERKAPFNDIRVRKAVAHLINRNKLIEKLFYSQYLPLNSYFPASAYENPNAPKYEYDPEKAAALLAEAGYKTRNSEGILMKDGKPFQLRLNFVQGQERFLTVIQEDFKKVGIQLDLKESDGSTMFTMVNERKFELTYQAWGGLLFPNPESSMHSKTADPQNTTNLPGTKIKRIDELCDEYNVCFDQKRRVAIIREVDSLACADVGYALFWYGPFSRFAYWNRFSMPKGYIARTGDYMSTMSLWSYDPEKDAELEAAIKDKKKRLPLNPFEDRFWIEWTKQNEALFKSL